MVSSSWVLWLVFVVVVVVVGRKDMNCWISWYVLKSSWYLSLVRGGLTVVSCLSAVERLPFGNWGQETRVYELLFTRKIWEGCLSKTAELYTCLTSPGNTCGLCKCIIKSPAAL